MNRIVTGLLSVLLMTPVIASAEHKKNHRYTKQSSVSYDFFDIRAVTENFDDDGPDSDGFGIRGSLSLSDSIHIFGKYTWRELDIIGPNIRDNEGNLGLGVNFPVSTNLDLVLQGSYEWIDVDTPGFGDFEDNGLGALAGLRAKLSPEFELNGHVRYRDLDDLEEETYLGASAIYTFSNGASLGGEWERSDLDTTRWGLFVRFDF